MTRDSFVLHSFHQNQNVDFSKSKRKYSELKQECFCKSTQKWRTCEETWLVYFVSLGKVFCGPCLLFKHGNNSLPAST